MASARLLGGVSMAQLATGVAGMALAIKRRHPYNTPVKRGAPERVGRDSILNGTALSAPVTMLVTQAVAARVALRGAPSGADTVLGGLGATMVSGYLAESLCRRRLHPSDFDVSETPLVIMGISLSIAMAVLGFRERRRRLAGADS